MFLFRIELAWRSVTSVRTSDGLMSGSASSWLAAAISPTNSLTRATFVAMSLMALSASAASFDASASILLSSRLHICGS